MTKAEPVDRSYTTELIVGAAGTPATRVGSEADEAAPEPPTLIAETVNR
jgi:hypothetical protein